LIFPKVSLGREVWGCFSNCRLSANDEVIEAYDAKTLEPNDNLNPCDPAFDGLTLYEKKPLLINRELDSMGMGKYHWYIWGLCGLGYFLNLL
jgi:hypothetical protein